MSYQLPVNDQVIPDSNPASPASEFMIEIPLDEFLLHDPVPEADNYEEVDTLPSESSESDLSSYSFNYYSDNNEDGTGQRPGIYPVIPCTNYSQDQDNPEDQTNWVKLHEDDVWSVPLLPLLRPGGVLNMFSNERQPEHFFEALFDQAMWTQIVDETNRYATGKIRQFGPCPVSAMEHPNYKKYSRLNVWKEITENELKLFVAHLLLMGILRKSEIEKYWNTSGVGQTPFFGKLMSRNRFTAILSNLHICNDSANPPFGSPGHDPLAKIRSFVSMCEENFRFAYIPKQDLSMDESCCPWKGRLRFKVYNPRKPARFHIKLFQMCESTSGYIIGFCVYTGKNSCKDPAVCLYDECTTTTQIVMTLANRCNLLDKGHRIFCDNYYTSPELVEELLHRDTSSCGTVRSDRKGLPKALKKTKLKPGETCFRRSRNMNGEPGSLLALKWCDKREVYMLSSCHAATEQWTGRMSRNDGSPIYKPSCIVDYIQKMGGVDLSDQLLTYYSFLRKTGKWWRKLWVHMLNMLVLNAYILNSKFGERKLNHSDYREYIAEYLIRQANKTYESVDIDNFLLSDRLFGRHWPMKLERNHSGRIVPRRCKVCYVGLKENMLTGKPRKTKSTSYKCQQCNIAMCIDPCFRIYHVEKDYKSFV